MDKLFEIRSQLMDMAEQEAMRMYRLARKALDHGCSSETARDIREEANWLHTTGTAYPERLLDPDFHTKFKYAFHVPSEHDLPKYCPELPDDYPAWEEEGLDIDN